MKTRSLTDRARRHASRVPRQPARALQDGRPPVARRTRALRSPARCERCEAVYADRVWRPAGTRARDADLAGVHWTLCPACAQIRDQEWFGRIRVTTPLPADREVQVRRRIWNVERRARHTQPEHRLVQIERRREGLEVLTTSQKLAHRIAAELEKAFGGRTTFRWTDREGALDATWRPSARFAPAATPPRTAAVRAAAPTGRRTRHA
jgi:hypothetical protein